MLWFGLALILFTAEQAIKWACLVLKKPLVVRPLFDGKVVSKLFVPSKNNYNAMFMSVLYLRYSDFSKLSCMKSVFRCAVAGLLGVFQGP